MNKELENKIKYAIRTQLSTFDEDEIIKQMNEDFELLITSSESVNFDYDPYKGIRFFDPFSQLHCTKYLYRNAEGWTLWTNE